MTTGLVVFRAAGSEWAVAVDQARAVRPAGEVAPLPAPGSGVAGVLHVGGQALAVLSVFRADEQAAGPGHVLVLEAGGRSFGLLVDEVTGVRRVAEADLGPPPGGQDPPIVAAVVRAGGEGEGLMFVVDAAVLAGLAGPQV